MTRRTRTLVQAAVALALATCGTAAASAEPFIPGYTDFPNALRVADQQQGQFIPGYTDFPNALRIQGSPLTLTEQAQLAAATKRAIGSVRPTASDAGIATTSSGEGFDWGDAGIGGGVAAGALLLLATAIALVGRDRRLVRTS